MTHPLLERCRALGIRLEADGDNLAIDAPAGSLTPELLAEIREHKAALLAVLKEPSGEGTATPTPDPAPEPETATSGDGEPVTAHVHPDADITGHPIDAWLAAEDFGKWTCQNGRWTCPEASGDDFDALPDPGQPCPVCGSLDVLWGLWNETICQRCNPDKLARSFRLAERAQRLRQKARTV